MSNPIDPMIGWFDRLVAEGDEQKLTMLRNIYPLIMGEFGETFDPEKLKQQSISNGYGSRESMDILFPEQATQPKKLNQRVDLGDGYSFTTDMAEYDSEGRPIL